MPPPASRLRLRLARLDDVPLFERWDRDPTVIRATTDDPNRATAFEDADWAEEIASMDAHSRFLIAEVSGQPIGAMQVIDPALEATHYWGDVPHGLRALDIWIGEPEQRGKGHGSEMMRLALADCFAVPEVTAVLVDPLASNTRAHRFYQRLGFEVAERRFFGDDDCLVHRLSRETWEHAREARLTP